MNKACYTCKVILSDKNCCPSAFSKSEGTQCNSCRKKQRDGNRRNFPLRYILYRTKGNAKKRGIDFSLKISDLPAIPEFCPIFPWIRLEYQVDTVGKSKGAPGQSYGALSLDRIDNSKGYIPGNIQFISWRANWLKSNAETRELIALGECAKKSFKGLEIQYAELKCKCGNLKKDYQEVCDVCWKKSLGVC